MPRIVMVSAYYIECRYRVKRPEARLATPRKFAYDGDIVLRDRPKRVRGFAGRLARDLPALGLHPVNSSIRRCRVTMMDRVVRVDVYMRKRGAPAGRYRFLLSEPPASGADPLAAVRHTIEGLTHRFPEFEYRLISRTKDEPAEDAFEE